MNRRDFLARLTMVFGAVAYAPGLEVLDARAVPTTYENFSGLGLTFEVLKDHVWQELGHITDFLPPSSIASRVEAEQTYLSALPNDPLVYAKVDGVPIRITVVGACWMDNTGDDRREAAGACLDPDPMPRLFDPPVATPGQTLYRARFRNGDAFFFPARTEAL